MIYYLLFIIYYRGSASLPRGKLIPFVFFRGLEFLSIGEECINLFRPEDEILFIIYYLLSIYI